LPATDTEPLYEFGAGHAGHHHIGHDDLDRRAALLGEFQRFRTVGCLQYLAAEEIEHAAGDLAHGRFDLKNGSRRRARTSASVLGPESTTSSTRYIPGVGVMLQTSRAASTRSLRSRSVTVRPSGIASRELSTRLNRSCSIVCAIVLTCVSGSPSSRSIERRM